ncbi:PH domain-containing protein [Nosocomiicoccus sp. HMSC067E10]|uniref:PH domain-containing protein n=1 Tax=Nosocomiicoccus sp. HMSC067E10 TaxID=1739271 RepID=UPI00352F1A88
MFQKCDLAKEVQEIMLPNEKFIVAYKTFRDSVTFTSKRIIFRDSQGITGKKVEVYSLPYNSIFMWSTENAGKLMDLNAELELWTRVGKIKIKLDKKINIREIDQLIAQVVLSE